MKGFIGAANIDTNSRLCMASAAAGHRPPASVRRIEKFFAAFARAERVVTAFSQGVNQSSADTDKVNSIINCHLLTGRIGRPGMGSFSLTGQPNATGGREVGGMASLLAVHLELGNEAHRRIVQTFWGSPTVPRRSGLKAVELFEAIHAGRVKAVWIIATNPVVILPDADRVREALRGCDPYPCAAGCARSRRAPESRDELRLLPAGDSGAARGDAGLMQPARRFIPTELHRPHSELER